MKEILEKIETLYAAFKEDAIKQEAKGNKQAGVRARTNALGLIAALREFRKASINATKK